jgi:hypothetical protein
MSEFPNCSLIMKSLDIRAGPFRAVPLDPESSGFRLKDHRVQ